MNDSDLLQMSLSVALPSLPAFLVCLLACVLLLVNGQPASAGSAAGVWALLGFAFLAVLTLAAPIGSVLLQRWVIIHAVSMNRTWIFGVYGLTTGLLRAVSYAFLLVAVLTSRPKTAAPVQPYNSPPYNPPPFNPR